VNIDRTNSTKFDKFSPFVVISKHPSKENHPPKTITKLDPETLSKHQHKSQEKTQTRDAPLIQQLRPRLGKTRLWNHISAIENAPGRKSKVLVPCPQAI